MNLVLFVIIFVFHALVQATDKIKISRTAFAGQFMTFPLVQKLGFLILARTDEVLVFPETGLVAAARKIRNRPDEVRRMIGAGIKANRYVRSAKTEAI